MQGKTRREFLGAMGATTLSFPSPISFPPPAEGRKRPNVVLVLADDLGYGDLGCHGNDKLKTPILDRLYAQSVRFTNFYVSSVCSPTRASLLTGRYSYRTGVIDTWVGLSMMRPGEVTLAELLAQAGYATGIFGKWHLGDNYPLRPMDRGFQESLVFKGWGIDTTPNPPDNHYSDPILFRNGKPGKHPGYCTDIFFDAAMQFIEQNREKPFLVYLPANVVHEPLQIAEEFLRSYKRSGLEDYTARVYGMIANLDKNVGRLLEKLRQLGLENDTLLFFLSDNGLTGPDRYNAGLRGKKSSVYEGGLKVPFFVRWPGALQAGRNIDRIAAHIDVLPSVLDACQITPPESLPLDGKSLLPLIAGKTAAWPDRMLFFQQSGPSGVHLPKPFANCAARSQRYKIVMSVPGEEKYAKSIRFGETQLYDIEKDPGESNDLARGNPEVVFEMRNRYQDWFGNVAAGIDPPVRNLLGSPQPNPVSLTSHEMRGPYAGRAPQDWEKVHQMAQTEPDGSGWWEVAVARTGRYEVTLMFGSPGAQRIPLLKPGKAYLRLGNVAVSQPIPPGAKSVAFSISLRAGQGRLEAFFTGQRGDGLEVSPFFVEVKWIGS